MLGAGARVGELVRGMRARINLIAMNRARSCPIGRRNSAGGGVPANIGGRESWPLCAVREGRYFCGVRTVEADDGVERAAEFQGKGECR